MKAEIAENGLLKLAAENQEEEEQLIKWAKTEMHWKSYKGKSNRYKEPFICIEFSNGDYYNTNMEKRIPK